MKIENRNQYIEVLHALHDYLMTENGSDKFYGIVADRINKKLLGLLKQRSIQDFNGAVKGLSAGFTAYSDFPGMIEDWILEKI